MTTLHAIPDDQGPGDYQDIPAGPGEPTYHTCKACGGAHFIQRCPAIWAALRRPGPDFGDPPPRPTPPPPPDIWDGQKIAYHFHKNLARFIATLRELSVITRAQWAVAYSEYMAPLNKTGTPLTAAHVLRVWDKMISGDVRLPKRAA